MPGVETQDSLAAVMTANVDASLEVGELAESVEGAASTAPARSDTATVGRVIEMSEIQGLALSGRNPVFPASLEAGVAGGLPASICGGNRLSLFSKGGAKNLREGLREIYFQPPLEIVGKFFEILPVGFREHECFPAGPPGRDHFLFDSPDRQNCPSQSDFSRHRYVAAHRGSGADGNEGRYESNPG